MNNDTRIIRTDLIQCPACGTPLAADVTWTEGDPWPSFVHVCDNCAHIITESEWDTVPELVEGVGVAVVER